MILLCHALNMSVCISRTNHLLNLKENFSRTLTKTMKMNIKTYKNDLILIHRFWREEAVPAGKVSSAYGRILC